MTDNAGRKLIRADLSLIRTILSSVLVALIVWFVTSKTSLSKDKEKLINYNKEISSNNFNKIQYLKSDVIKLDENKVDKAIFIEVRKSINDNFKDIKAYLDKIEKKIEKLK